MNVSSFSPSLTSLTSDLAFSSFLSFVRSSSIISTDCFSKRKKSKVMMMNDNLYISSFSHRMKKEKKEKNLISVIFNHIYTVCPIASGSSLKYIYMTIWRRDRIQPLFNYLLCRCRQMDGLTEDDECDEHSSMDNFASSITQMLSTGKKKRGKEREREK